MWGIFNRESAIALGSDGSPSDPEERGRGTKDWERVLWPFFGAGKGTVEGWSCSSIYVSELPFYWEILCPGIYVDAALLNIIADQEDPIVASPSGGECALVDHTYCTYRNGPRSTTNSPWPWPDLQIPQIPIQLSIHGIQRNQGWNRGLAPTPEGPRDPMPMSWCQVRCPWLDRSQLLGWHEKTEYNIREMVLMLWLIGVGQLDFNLLFNMLFC